VTERPAPDSVSQRSIFEPSFQSTKLSISQLLEYSHSQTPRNFCIPGSKLMAWIIVFDTIWRNPVLHPGNLCVPTFGFICRNSAVKCRGFRLCNSLFPSRVLGGGLWKQSVARQRDDSDVATGVSFGVASIFELVLVYM
jgi:hypothetical protein